MVLCVCSKTWIISLPVFKEFMIRKKQYPIRVQSDLGWILAGWVVAR